MTKKTAHASLHYAWIIFGVTFLTLIVTAGIRSTPTVLLMPLEEEFGWSRATVSFAVSIGLVMFGLCGPFAAALMERFGVRRVMVIALSINTTAAALTTFMREAWQLDLLWGLAVGTATGATATVLSATVANRWFVKRRGLVLGLLTASNATGQLIFLPLLAALATGLNWRAASWATSLAALLLIPIVGLLMRNWPRDVGLKPYGASPDSPDLIQTRRNPIKTALTMLVIGFRSPNFWLLAGSFFICGATTNGLIGTHLIPAAMDHGIAEVTAAELLAAIGLFDILGTTVSGWLTDRWDSRKLLCWYYTLRGLSLLFLPYALGSSFSTLLVFIVFYGLDWVATVPPTVRLTTDLFGRENGSIMFGWIMASHQLGAAFAASGAGLIYSWLGDYQVAFISAGLLALVAAGLVIRIGHGPKPEPFPALAVEAEVGADS
ncbi:MAG: MFS transporter [Chloroflexota bacterium]|nr:MFS transporter [Chloroflexota bacterium]